MEQQFISLINGKITDHYQSIKKLLFAKESYQSAIDTKNVSHYFTFLESTLQQPYNRLNSVCAFIEGDDGQQTDKMYPFFLLTQETKNLISDKFSEATNWANTLELSGVDPKFESICKENRLEKYSVKDSQL